MRSTLIALMLGFWAMGHVECQVTTETSSLTYIDNAVPYGFGQPVVVDVLGCS